MIRRVLPPLVLFFLLLLGLELLHRFVNAALIPSPGDLWRAFAQNFSLFARATQETLETTLAGWLLSLVLGLSFAFSCALWDLGRRAFLPFALFFQTVPIIAIAPLLVIYFGYGPPAVIASSFIVSVFPVLANTLLGLESSTPDQDRLFRLYHASRWQRLLKLQIPVASSSIFAGLKISVGLAVIGTVAGEFVAGGGLGAVIDSARTQQRTDLVFTAVFLLSLLGLGMMGALAAARRLYQVYRGDSSVERNQDENF